MTKSWRDFWKSTRQVVMCLGFACLFLFDWRALGPAVVGYLSISDWWRHR